MWTIANETLYIFLPAIVEAELLAIIIEALRPAEWLAIKIGWELLHMWVVLLGKRGVHVWHRLRRKHGCHGAKGGMRRGGL